MVQAAARMSDVGAATRERARCITVSARTTCLGGRRGDVNTLAKLAKVMLPGHGASLAEGAAHSAESGELVVLDLALIAADSSTVLGGDPSAGGAGKPPSGCAGVSIDVTRRKEDERELVASEER